MVAPLRHARESRDLCDGPLGCMTNGCIVVAPFGDLFITTYNLSRATSLLLHAIRLPAHSQSGNFEILLQTGEPWLDAFD